MSERHRDRLRELRSGGGGDCTVDGWSVGKCRVQAYVGKGLIDLGRQDRVSLEGLVVSALCWMGSAGQSPGRAHPSHRSPGPGNPHLQSLGGKDARCNNLLQIKGIHRE